MTTDPDASLRAIAQTKSYTGQSVFAALLFFTPVTWPIGLFLARQWRAEARRMEAIAGHSIPGQGCLGAIWWMGVASLVVWAILMVVWIGAS